MEEPEDDFRAWMDAWRGHNAVVGRQGRDGHAEEVAQVEGEGEEFRNAENRWSGPVTDAGGVWEIVNQVVSGMEGTGGRESLWVTVAYRRELHAHALDGGRCD